MQRSDRPILVWSGKPEKLLGKHGFWLDGEYSCHANGRIGPARLSAERNYLFGRYNQSLVQGKSLLQNRGCARHAMGGGNLTWTVCWQVSAKLAAEGVNLAVTHPDAWTPITLPFYSAVCLVLKAAFQKSYTSASNVAIFVGLRDPVASIPAAHVKSPRDQTTTKWQLLRSSFFLLICTQCVS